MGRHYKERCSAMTWWFCSKKIFLHIPILRVSNSSLGSGSGGARRSRGSACSARPRALEESVRRRQRRAQQRNEMSRGGLWRVKTCQPS